MWEGLGAPYTKMRTPFRIFRERFGPNLIPYSECFFAEGLGRDRNRVISAKFYSTTGVILLPVLSFWGVGVEGVLVCRSWGGGLLALIVARITRSLHDGTSTGGLRVLQPNLFPFFRS